MDGTVSPVKWGQTSLQWKQCYFELLTSFREHLCSSDSETVTLIWLQPWAGSSCQPWRSPNFHSSFHLNPEASGSPMSLGPEVHDRNSQGPRLNLLCDQGNKTVTNSFTWHYLLDSVRYISTSRRDVMLLLGGGGGMMVVSALTNKKIKIKNNTKKKIPQRSISGHVVSVVNKMQWNRKCYVSNIQCLVLTILSKTNFTRLTVDKHNVWTNNLPRCLMGCDGHGPCPSSCCQSSDTSTNLILK